MLVKFTEEDRKNDDNGNNEPIEKHKKEQSNPEDLKDFVDESTRIRLSENDLKILEETLLNPPPPNDKLKGAAENYKKTQRDALIEMMKNDQELGLYDEQPLYVSDNFTIGPNGAFETEEIEEPIKNERTQLQKLEDYVKPSTPPQNASEMMLTTNNDIIESIPPDDEISNWDETLMDGLEEEIFQEEPTIEEEVQNFSTIEDDSTNIFQEEIKTEFEIPEQEGWTEELEQQYWEEQVPEPFATPEEVEKFKIDIQSIEKQQPIQTITIDEEKFKPFEVDLRVEEPTTEPFTEVTVEKKNF
jgi:hypothetical protein